jgi:glyoxylase-like metal-dependent hydrolase (beta-lactamase superfamily II)
VSDTGQPPDKHAWERPGAFEVGAGVWRIPLPLPNDGLHAVNVYALVTDGRVTMVDGGWALEESRTRLEDSLAAIGHDLGEVDRFLVTHSHRDHYTQAIAIRRTLGTRVLIGAEEAHSLGSVTQERGIVFPWALTRELRRHGAAALVDSAIEHAPERPDREEEQRMLADFAGPDEWIPDGARLEAGGRTLTAVHTPGHTRGHLVFHDETAGVLFTGDHLLPHITPSIGYEGAPARSPLGDYLASLELTLRMPDAVMLPAHGPAGGSTRDRARALTDHHRDRLDDTERAVAAGAGTAHEVAKVLPWTSRKRSLAELDRWNAMLAVHETVTHLVVLADDGRVRATDDGTVIHYSV